MQTRLVSMIKTHLLTKRFLIACTAFTLIISGFLFVVNIQIAQGKKNEEEKVKKLLKATVNLNIKWNIDDETKKNQGSYTLTAIGALKLNKEMSSMDQGLPTVMVNYKNQNMRALITYNETLSDKDPPDDCPNSIIERYRGSRDTMVATVPGPGNLILNHYSSLFKDTGLGDMIASATSGMLVDHFLFVVPCNVISINGQKLDRQKCVNRPSTKKIKSTVNITGKILKNGKMEGGKTWTAKANSASSHTGLSVKLNELPKTMNKKPFSPVKASDGDVTYTLSWKIEKLEPHILIYRLKDNEWHDITDGKPDEEEQEIFPGEKLILRAMVVMPGESGEPPKGQWEIAEKDWILKDWVAWEKKSEKVKVGKTDKREIEFFWWKKVKKAVVKYKVSGNNLTGKTEFKLIMPKVNVVEQPGKQWGFEKDGGCEIVPDSPSIKLTSTVSTEKNMPFCIQYVQLVESTNWSLKWEQGNRALFWYKDVHKSMLDDTYPYKEMCLAEAGPVVFEMRDTPSADGSPYTALLNFNQNFQLYLMFRPGNKDAGNAWVPLRKVNWGWIFKGTNTVTPFEPEEAEPCEVRFKMSSSCKLPIANNFQSIKAEDYPKWTGVVKKKKEMDRTDIRVEEIDYDGKNPHP